jgi:hypothetical protein
VTTSTELPPLGEEAQLILVPEDILLVRERRLRNKVIKEYLVKWKELPIEDATWEGEQVLQHLELQLLEHNQFREGGAIMSFPA